MDKEMFIQHLKKQLQERTGCEIRQQTVTKNNGVKRTAFIIMREDKNVHPSIYIDNFYDLFLNGETYENIINKIMKFEQKEGLNTNFNVNDFLDYEKIKGNLYYRIINYHENITMLKNMPHKKYLDLARVYYVVVESPEIGMGSILINKEYTRVWGVTEDEIDRVAKINTEIKMQPTVRNINEMVKKNLMYLFEQAVADGEIPADLKMPNMDKYMGELPMYVVTNRQYYYGASVLMYAGFLKAVSEVMKDNLIIFPSSVHEFIFMKFETAFQCDYKTLKGIVEHVNAEVVDPEEYLSNNVYLYDRQKNELRIYNIFEG